MAFDNIKDGLMRDLSSLGSLLSQAFIAIMIYLFDSALSIKLFAGIILCTAITALIRIVHFKDRPKKQKFANFIERIDSSSFPSLHSMRAAFLAVMIYFSFKSLPFSAFFVALALMIGYSRVYLKKHFWTDVLAGWLFGIVLAVILQYTTFLN